MPVITSLLDNDFYKFSMQQAIFHHYRDISAESQLIFRGQTANISLLIKEIRDEMNHLGQLRLSERERAWLEKQHFFHPDYLDFLSAFSLNTEAVSIGQNPDAPGGISITVRGKWLDITLFEIYILAIISELYGNRYANENTLDVGREHLQEKIAYFKTSLKNQLTLMDYGTRRRFSSAWHKEVMLTLLDELPDINLATSNARLAMDLDLPVAGTMGHEWIQAHQALTANLAQSQKIALSLWLEEYSEKKNIAVTDTIDFTAFARDFTPHMAKNYHGVRHDSGDPFLWGEAILELYRTLGINSRDKTLVFSDGLDFTRINMLVQHFQSRAGLAFGIGTRLSNDVGLPPLRIVHKMVKCNGYPVAKISDTPGKAFCVDNQFMQKLRKAYCQPDCR